MANEDIQAVDTKENPTIVCPCPNSKDSSINVEPLQQTKKRSASSENTLFIGQEQPPTKKPREPKKFIYGNYDRYYGYRNQTPTDIRLDTFKAHSESLFRKADVLDIGCNTGHLTIAIARQCECRSMVGIDIDKSLITAARKQLSAERRRFSSSTTIPQPTLTTPIPQPCPTTTTYPTNVSFMPGNYVLNDEKLLDLEQPKFDTILCLSLTKWIHLNFGDDGLKLAFRRMFRQLRPGGQLVLEAQDWKGYKRRKKLSKTIEANYEAIRMQPQHFQTYLLGPDVGFVSVYTLEIEDHKASGFRRPIRVYVKAGERVIAASNTEEILVNSNNP